MDFLSPQQLSWHYKKVSLQSMQVKFIKARREYGGNGINWMNEQVNWMNEPMWYPNSSPIFSLVVVICYVQEDAHDHAKVPSSWVPGGVQKQTQRRRWFRRSPPPARPPCQSASCWRPEAMCSSLDSSGTDSLEGMLGHGPRWSMVVRDTGWYCYILLLHKGCLQRSPVSCAPCHG